MKFKFHHKDTCQLYMPFNMNKRIESDGRGDASGERNDEKRKKSTKQHYTYNWLCVRNYIAVFVLNIFLLLLFFFFFRFVPFLFMVPLCMVYGNTYKYTYMLMVLMFIVRNIRFLFRSSVPSIFRFLFSVRFFFV